LHQQLVILIAQSSLLTLLLFIFSEKLLHLTTFYEQKYILARHNTLLNRNKFKIFHRN